VVEYKTFVSGYVINQFSSTEGKMASTTPLPEPSADASLNASRAAVGAPISPLRRLAIMEEDEWEEFILEWVDSMRANQTYVEVHRCGSKGDMGRDVIGFKGPVGPTTAWDNYQCKHYQKNLSVADTVKEFGKLCYYIAQGAFTAPDQYVFVTPKGQSTDLLKCIQGGTLRDEVIARWDKEVAPGITKTKVITLTPAIRAVIDAYDIATISVASPIKIIEDHRKTRYFVFRFGGGIPSRDLPIPKPPTEFQPQESSYIKKLFDAYADEKKTPFPTIAQLHQGAPELANHLDRSREQFFSAESLRAFSRDNVQKGTFERLQDELHDGIQEVYHDDQHTSGYRRAVKTVQKARDIQLTSNPLLGVLLTNDRAGICHQLANDDKLTWVREPKQ
jgi:hypothetical protein